MTGNSNRHNLCVTPLEIIDECGGYTIWDEWFDTEQAALDKALRAVSAFGIDSFLEDNRSRPTHH